MMKTYTLIFVWLLSIFSQLIFGQLAMAAEPIGRLFTSPAERSNLDHLRQTRKLNAPVKIDESADALEAAPIVLPREVNLQGYVKRNDGKEGTVWVNGEAVQENSGNKDIQVGRLPEDSNRVPVKLSGNGKRLNLKAGQVYDPETNRVHEARHHGAQGDSGTIGQPEF